MIKPENLPDAPNPALDPIYALEILEKSKEEKQTVQSVFTRSLIEKVLDWGEEMESEKTSLEMSHLDIQAYLNGFTLPLFCLYGTMKFNTGGINALEEFISELRELGFNPSLFEKFLVGRLEVYVDALTEDPSGILLLRLFPAYPPREAPLEFLEGQELCSKVYESYWSFFSSPIIAREVRLY